MSALDLDLLSEYLDGDQNEYGLILRQLMVSMCYRSRPAI